MEVLTLELLDVTVSQALREIRDALERHPDLALRLVLGPDPMLRTNVEKLLERQGRTATVRRTGRDWTLDVPPGAATPTAITPTPAPTPLPPPTKPVLLLRSAFTPGDRALGRQLLLETLRAMDPATSWLALAHDALDLLDDPSALAVLKELEGKGLSIRLSKATLAYAGRGVTPFPAMDDALWQKAMTSGNLVVL